MRLAFLVVFGAGLVWAQQKETPATESPSVPKTELEKLKKENEALKKEVERLKKEVETLRKENEALKKEGGLKKVAGRLTVFEEKKRLGIVTLGSAAGLKGGEVVEVMRKGRCVGKMRVLTVFDENVSNAKLIEGKARSGDEVVVWVRSIPGLDERLMSLEKRVKALEERIERLIEVLSSMKRTGEPKKAGQEPVGKGKVVVARVMIVVPKDEVVVLDVGSQHGVKKGDLFEVYREGKPIAKLVVQESIKEMSRALILEKTLMPQKDDRAVKIKK